MKHTAQQLIEIHNKELEYLKEGLNLHEIASTLNISLQSALKYKRYLVESNLITEEEVKQYLETRKQEENDLFDELVLKYLLQGKSKTYIQAETNHDYYDVTQSISRILKTHPEINHITKEKKTIIEDNIDKVETLIREHKYPIEIAKTLNLTRGTLSRYTNILLERNRITKEDLKYRQVKITPKKELIYKSIEDGLPYEEIQKKYHISKSYVSMVKKEYKTGIIQKRNGYAGKIYEPKPIDNLLTEQEINIINLLNEGYTYNYISRHLNIEKHKLMNTIYSLKNRKYLCLNTIKQQQIEKMDNYKQEVLSLIRQGYTQSDIMTKFNSHETLINKAWLSRTISKFIEDGILTEQGIKEYQLFAPSGTYETDSKVRMYLLRGYTAKEMIEDDPDGYLTLGRIMTSKKRLLNTNLISKNDISRAKSARNKEKKKENNKALKKEIETLYIKYNYSCEDISRYFNESYLKVLDLRKQIISSLKLDNKSLKELRLSYINDPDKLLLLDINLINNLEQLTNYLKFAREYVIKLTDDISNKTFITIGTHHVNIFNNFMDIISKLNDLNYNISKSDYKRLEYIIVFYEEFHTIDRLNWLVNLYVKNKLYKEAEIFVNYYVLNSNNKKELMQMKHEIIVNIRAESGNAEAILEKRYIRKN